MDILVANIFYFDKGNTIASITFMVMVKQLIKDSHLKTIITHSGQNVKNKQTTTTKAPTKLLTIWRHWEWKQAETREWLILKEGNCNSWDLCVCNFWPGSTSQTMRGRVAITQEEKHSLTGLKVRGWSLVLS